MQRKRRPDASQWDITNEVWRKPKDYSRVENGIVYLPISEVCDLVKRSRRMITYWYEWWESLTDDQRAEYPHPLPEYRRDFTSRGDRFWRKEDIPQLRRFRDQIERGVFSGYSAKWRGDKKKEDD